MKTQKLNQIRLDRAGGIYDLRCRSGTCERGRWMSTQSVGFQSSSGLVRLCQTRFLKHIRRESMIDGKAHESRWAVNRWKGHMQVEIFESPHVDSYKSSGATPLGTKMEDRGSRMAGSNRRLGISKKANEFEKIQVNPTKSNQIQSQNYDERTDEIREFRAFLSML